MFRCYCIAVGLFALLPLLLSAQALPAAPDSNATSTAAEALLQRPSGSSFRVPLVPGDLRFSTEQAFPLTFAEPIGLHSPPGETNRLFVVEKPGRIMVITNLVEPTSTVFLDLSHRVYFEQECGLLDMAFHPGFATNRFFFITYTFSTNNAFDGIHLRLARFQVSTNDPNAAVADSEEPLITQYDGDPWHQGGGLAFGPDGCLYVSVGDGGQMGSAHVQRIDREFFGGILRLDVDHRPGSLRPNPHPGVGGSYWIPADNPFIGASTFNGFSVDPERVRTEFFAVGLRNPWRFSFDPQTGALYCNDTGSSYREEVNLVLKGRNHGWPFEEGNLVLRESMDGIPRPPNLFPPLASYGYDSGGAGSGKAIAAGLLYRGPAVPSLEGAYLFSDFWTGDIAAIRPRRTDVLPTLRELEAELESLKRQEEAVLSGIEERQKVWEDAWRTGEGKWRLLSAATASSSDGATLVQESDGVLKVTGELPWKDSYRVEAPVPLPRITAIRLEVLPDPALPGSGPGRSSGGNFVLTEFTIELVSGAGSTTSAPMRFAGAHSDYSQPDWDVSGAIDGNPATGWAIAPAVGLPHQAVFELSPAIESPTETHLAISLQQWFGGQGTIGRFRLWVTDAPPPLPADPAATISDILRLPPADRTGEQRERVARYHRSIDPELASLRAQVESVHRRQADAIRAADYAIESIAREPGIAAFALHPGTGEILMADMINGIVRRLAIDPQGGSFPEKLEETGLFQDLTTLAPAPGLVPYEINVPFWSDGAAKRRWFSVASTNDFIGFSATDPWTFPAGMVWVKHFDLEMEKGVPGSARRLETRILVKNFHGIHGATYRWDAAGTSATLVPAGGMEEELVTTGAGSEARQIWKYPSRTQCLQCHTRSGGFALGFHTAQLNRMHEVAGARRRQIESLRDAGYFSPAPAPLHDLPALAPAEDPAASREYRVRSFLAANCAHCHQPGATGRSLWDARITTPTELAGLIRGTVVHGAPDPADRIVTPGSPERSVLWQRLSQLDARHMPPLGSTLPHPEAIALIADWIRLDLASYESFEDWRLRHFPDPASADPGGDPDGDGLGNFPEYLLGSNPTHPDRRPGIEVVREEGRTRIRFRQPAHLNAQAQFSDTPWNSASWRTLDVPGNEPRFSAQETERIVEDPAADGPMRYYRVIFRRP